MPLTILHNNIVNMKTDVIVNATNPQLLMRGGVGDAIFHRAGVEELQKECASLSPIGVGEIAVIKAHHLNVKYIIHAVGPVYQDGNHCEKELLERVYLKSLHKCLDLNCQSISFPLISSGNFGYPKEDALNVAVETIKNFLNEYEMDVYLVVFDRKSVKIAEALYNDVKHYIDTYFIEERLLISRNYCETVLEDEFCFNSASLQKRVNNIKETFSEMLLRLIDERKMTDAEVYKRANIDRKLFSKLRKKEYHPSKKTILALAIALRLDLDTTLDLLKKAGYTLSDSQKGDIILRYFIEREEYDIFTINEVLFCFEEETL